MHCDLISDLQIISDNTKYKGHRKTNAWNLAVQILRILTIDFGGKFEVILQCAKRLHKIQMSLNASEIQYNQKG